MSRKKRNVKVTLPERKHIPTVGWGPITSRPIHCTEEQVKLFKILGIECNVVGEDLGKIDLIDVPHHEGKESHDDDLHVSEIEVHINDHSSDSHENEHLSVPHVDSHVTAAEHHEDVLTESQDHKDKEEEEAASKESEDVLEGKEVNTLTKAECKKILDAKKVKYTYNATLEELRKLVTENVTKEK